MPTTPEFEIAYKRLNKEQKKAVDTIEGPVMVIAGPGTGKTQILALRIANILLKTDTDPRNVLALSFTESGVYSMRKRLLSIIGPRAHKVAIFTFHGFCNDVITSFPEEFPRIIGARNATEIDQIRIMEEIITDATLEYLKPYGDILYYLRPVLNMIRNLKREDISPEEFLKLVLQQEKDFENIPDLYHEKGAHKGKMKGEFADLQKKIAKNKELQKLYSQYEKKLEQEKLYDYEDMIVEVVKALQSNNDLLLQLQERHQYILADEHQDANRSQNEILELLSNFHDNPNIFIVGDEKQAIFRFQGASLENFLYFKKLYPTATLIALTHNYRSAQYILDAAHSLILNNPGTSELRKKLVAAVEIKSEFPKILLHMLPDRNHEIAWITQDILTKIKQGIAPEEIAVIYRENRDAEQFMISFQKAGVPFSVQSDQNIFEDEEINKLLTLFQTLDDLGNNEKLVPVLYMDFFKLGPINIYKLIHCAHKKHLSLFDALASEECLHDAHVSDPKIFIDFFNTLSAFATIAKNKNLVEATQEICTESGFLAHILGLPLAAEKISKLEQIFAMIEEQAATAPQVRLKDFVQYIDLLRKYNIQIKTGDVGQKKGSIHLMTAHRSKGLEYEYVYISGLYDGHWGNKREIRHFHIPIKGFFSVGVDPLEDERRLLYVAMTRAKKYLSLSVPEKGLRGEELLPSQFLNEIDSAYIEVVPSETLLTTIDKKLLQHYSPQPKSAKNLHDQEFFKTLFLEYGLSVTALNKYLSCPWDYFFNNLLRIPHAKTKHQLYGTAIHNSLRDFFTAYSREADISKKELLTIFQKYLRGLIFTKNDFEESLIKGTEALGGYYDTYKNTWPRALMTEFSISGVTVEIGSGTSKETLQLHGILDKVELLGDDKVRVIDYKTAKPKSRNAIMGKTKTEAGEYYRQLVFYKLLLNGHTNAHGTPQYSMESGVIDFVEPDERGKYHREEFSISDTEVDELKKLIQKTAQEIIDLDFWNKNCDDKTCEWCKLRALIS